MMIRQIVVPTQNNYTLELPDEMVGKKVEVIAFEIETGITERIGRKRTFAEALVFFRQNAVDFSAINKWNREDLYE
ncbi:MAG: hypothetical protein KF781_10965 [Chitinophagaceae bacterium]|nr:hypothetical protein [Chitinophagaceae bacterium]MCW5906182.1 hypothetical protein [Chitinophagaceae bacterium]